MKFKTDENLPVEVVAVLRDHGHDTISVVEQQLGGAADEIIAKVCQSEQRILMTLDLDFADIRTYPPEEYFGIIIVRPKVQTISAIIRLTEQVVRHWKVRRQSDNCGSWTNLTFEYDQGNIHSRPR